MRTAVSRRQSEVLRAPPHVPSRTRDESRAAELGRAERSRNVRTCRRFNIYYPRYESKKKKGRARSPNVLLLMGPLPPRPAPPHTTPPRPTWCAQRIAVCFCCAEVRRGGVYCPPGPSRPAGVLCCPRPAVRWRARQRGGGSVSW